MSSEVTPANVIGVREPNAERAELLARRLELDGFQVSCPGTWVVGERRPSGEGPQSGRTFVAEGPGWLARADGIARFEQALSGGTLGKLPGDFTVLHINDGSVAHAVSAVAGAVPLYYARQRESVAVATRLKDLSRYFLDEVELDLLSVTLHLTLWVFPEDRAFLKGVSVLPPGHRLTLGDRVCIERYFDPGAQHAEPPTRAAFVRASEELRETLTQRIARILPADGNLLAVSGGVDSSIVACVAGGWLGRRFHRLTFVLPSSKEADIERAYVRSVERYVGERLSGSFDFELTPARLLAAAREAPLALTPLVAPLTSAVRCVLERASVRTYAGGEFADELFGSQTVFDDWMSGVSVSSLSARPGALPLVLRHARGVVRTKLASARGALPLACGFLTAVSAELRAAHQDHVRDWQRRLAGNPRGAFPLRLARAHALKASYWESLSDLGIRPAYPFLGRETLELALRVHPLQNASFTGKRLLRHAFRGRAPALNLSRPDKGLTTEIPMECAWNEPIPVELERAVRSGWTESPPAVLSAEAALHLRGLLNIVGALRNERLQRDCLGKSRETRPAR